MHVPSFIAGVGAGPAGSWLAVDVLAVLQCCRSGPLWPRLAAATSKYGHLDTGHQLGIHDQDILSPATATGGTVRHRLVSRIRGYTTFGKPEIGDSAAFLLNPGR